MQNGNDRRSDPRVPIDLPVEIKAPQGIIKGKTANISVGGMALLVFSKSFKIDDEFDITIQLSKDRAAPVTCRKIWMGKLAAFIAVGVQFIKISPDDRDIIAMMVKKYTVF